MLFIYVINTAPPCPLHHSELTLSHEYKHLSFHQSLHSLQVLASRVILHRCC